ncbi:MAG: hypothetical protein AB1714_31385 [Acidobacteriota bacterium]
MDIEDIKSKIVSEVLALLTPKTRALEGEIQTLKQTIASALDVMQQKARISIERDLSGIIDSKLAALAEGVRAEAEQAAAEKLAAARAAERAESTLFQALQAVDRGRSQVEILSTLMTSVHVLAPRVLLLVAKADSLAGWSAQGFKLNDAAIKKMSIPLSLNTTLKHVCETTEFFWGEASSHQDNARVFATLGGQLPNEILVTPLVFKGKTVAILYCDDGGQEEALKNVEHIKILAWTASNTLEALAYRAKGTRPLAPPSAAAPAEHAVAAPPPAPPPLPPPPPAVAIPTVRDERARTNPELITRIPTAPPMPPIMPVEPAMPPEERKKHDDAKRLARVLVADLILYHRSEVEMGRKNKDLYIRLQEDIDRSKQTYLERVGMDFAKRTNYLYEELVRTLADGRSEALVGYQP